MLLKLLVVKLVSSEGIEFVGRLVLVVVFVIFVGIVLLRWLLSIER